MQVTIDLDEVRNSVMPVFEVICDEKRYILGSDVEIDEIMFSSCNDDEKIEKIKDLALCMVMFYRNCGIIKKNEKIKEIRTVDFAF